MAQILAVGIHFGATSSCVGIYQNGKIKIIVNDQGNTITPSCVAFTDNECLIGEAALRQASTDHKNTILDIKHLVGIRFDDTDMQKNMKRWSFTVIRDNDKPKIQVKFKGKIIIFSPEEICAMILRKMRDMAEADSGQRVSDVVITVPAYFDESRCRAITNAGTMAGLNVLSTVSTPISAVNAYGLQRTIEECNVFVFRLGGSTFDASVVNIKNGISDTKSIVYNTRLGGKDITENLIKHFSFKFTRKYKKNLRCKSLATVLNMLQVACEEAKKTLSSSLTADIDICFRGVNFRSSITRQHFEELNLCLFQIMFKSVEKALRDAATDKSEIQDVVLVGGSTRIPKVRKLLRDFFDGKESKTSISPDEAVAYGAAVQASILRGNERVESRDLMLLDAAPSSFGIEANGIVNETGSSTAVSSAHDINDNIACEKSRDKEISCDPMITVSKNNALFQTFLSLECIKKIKFNFSNDIYTHSLLRSPRVLFLENMDGVYVTEDNERQEVPAALEGAAWNNVATPKLKAASYGCAWLYIRLIGTVFFQSREEMEKLFSVEWENSIPSYPDRPVTTVRRISFKEALKKYLRFTISCDMDYYVNNVNEIEVDLGRKVESFDPNDLNLMEKLEHELFFRLSLRIFGDENDPDENSALEVFFTDFRVVFEDGNDVFATALRGENYLLFDYHY